MVKPPTKDVGNSPTRSDQAECRRDAHELLSHDECSAGGEGSISKMLENSARARGPTSPCTDDVNDGGFASGWNLRSSGMYYRRQERQSVSREASQRCLPSPRPRTTQSSFASFSIRKILRELDLLRRDACFHCINRQGL